MITSASPRSRKVKNPTVIHQAKAIALMSLVLIFQKKKDNRSHLLNKYTHLPKISFSTNMIQRFCAETMAEMMLHESSKGSGAGEVPFVGSFTEFVIGGSGGIRLFFEFEKFFTRCCQKFLFKRVYPIFIPFFKVVMPLLLIFSSTTCSHHFSACYM
ncbi:unnamed protein product, partial [Vitis vinifera]|uniref:Uncharacterized protein n=1 Tax=Vitis vinifera TaxID=29760 RepID=D7U0A0_VITVI